jgi:hypothetical protein
LIRINFNSNNDAFDLSQLLLCASVLQLLEICILESFDIIQVSVNIDYPGENTCGFSGIRPDAGFAVVEVDPMV